MHVNCRADFDYSWILRELRWSNVLQAYQQSLRPFINPIRNFFPFPSPFFLSPPGWMDDLYRSDSSAGSRELTWAGTLGTWKMLLKFQKGERSNRRYNRSSILKRKLVMLYFFRDTIFGIVQKWNISYPSSSVYSRPQLEFLSLHYRTRKLLRCWWTPLLQCFRINGLITSI